MMKSGAMVVFVVATLSVILPPRYGEATELPDPPVKVGLRIPPDSLCDEPGMWFIRFPLQPEALCVEFDRVVNYDAKETAVISVGMPMADRTVNEMVFIRSRIEWDHGWAKVEDLGSSKGFYDYKGELEVVASSLQAVDSDTGLRRSTLSNGQIRAMSGFERMSWSLNEAKELEAYWDDDQVGFAKGIALCEAVPADMIYGKADCVYFLLTESFVIELPLSLDRLKSKDFRSVMKAFVRHRLIGRGGILGSSKNGAGNFEIEIQGTRLSIPHGNFSKYSKYRPLHRAIILKGEIPHNEVYYAPVHSSGRWDAQDLASVDVTVFLEENPESLDSKPGRARDYDRRKCRESELGEAEQWTSPCNVNFLLAPGLKVEYLVSSSGSFDLDHIDKTVREFLKEIIRADQ